MEKIRNSYEFYFVYLKICWNAIALSESIVVTAARLSDINVLGLLFQKDLSHSVLLWVGVRRRALCVVP